MKEKKYRLSENESKNIKFRRMAMDLIMNAMNNDMGSYIYREVLPRLGLKDVKVEITEDGEWLVEMEEKKILNPNGKV